MTNMIPQAPDNNQGPWANMENYLRTLIPANELYIVAGGAGTGGTGSNGGVTNNFAGGKVTVPAFTWKVALVIPKADGDDISRVSAATRTIAVIMPNSNTFNGSTIRDDDWRNFLVSIDQVEQLTGYNFYENLPDAIENSVEAGIDGNNPPGTANQVVNVAEDNSVSITLDAAGLGNLTYEVVNQPTNGSLSGTGATRTYTPNPNFNGTDSFTFRVNDGQRNSNTSKVLINITEVNDDPVAGNDNRMTDEDAALSFAASELTQNDSTGAANENNQTLTVTKVISIGNTNGQVSLSNGQINYQPNLNYNGEASFNYEVCDNGKTNGSSDSKCVVGTVIVAVSSVNDRPILAPIVDYTVLLGSSLNATTLATDADLPNDSLIYSLTGVVPAGASIDSATGVITWTPSVNQAGKIYTLTVRVTDKGGLFAESQFKIKVAYEWSNLLSPIATDGSSVFKSNQTVPVKFQLTGAAQNVTNAVAALFLAKVTNGILGTEFPAVASGNANQGNLFRSEGGQYIYNLSTKGLATGIYQLRVDLGDGERRTVLIELK
jgi:hypothetical protein